MSQSDEIYAAIKGLAQTKTEFTVKDLNLKDAANPGNHLLVAARRNWIKPSGRYFSRKGKSPSGGSYRPLVIWQSLIWKNS